MITVRPKSLGVKRFLISRDVFQAVYGGGPPELGSGATATIKHFLAKSTLPDLAALYHFGMECQVNVAQDNGELVTREHNGHRWHEYHSPQNDGEIWKNQRIPYGSDSEPFYDDWPFKFDFPAHVDCIGMSGWDWVARQSRWVAFDFDSITGHKGGKRLDEQQLTEVRSAVERVPWTTLRKSTSGSGLHLYVFIDPVPTANHDEHAAVARAVLDMLSRECSRDLQAEVDACGRIMWVWARKMKGTDGLTLLKDQQHLAVVPQNWRDHLPVITGRSAKVKKAGTRKDEMLDRMLGKVPLDAEHQRHIDWLTGSSWASEWDGDRLKTHTVGVTEMHQALGLRGQFDTNSNGSDPHKYNCFLCPLKYGGWRVVRYGEHVEECDGWTRGQKGPWRLLNVVQDGLHPDAYYGLIGEFVRAAENSTEAAPVSLLLQSLIYLGAAAGRKFWFPVEATHHYPNLFGVLVGDTAGGRKGTSEKWPRRLFGSLSAPKAEGLSSGEGLIWAVRDPIEKKGKDKGDPGVTDKRLLVIETEFVGPLKMMQRQGNTLGNVLRSAWDGEDLRTLTKNSPARATEPHISFIGHITHEELVASFSNTDTFNGFSNRILWCSVHRARLLPNGGPPVDLAPFQTRLQAVLAMGGGEMKRDKDATALWEELYFQMDKEAESGAFGAATKRAEAQVLRLSMLYAIADGSLVIRVEHLGGGSVGLHGSSLAA